MSSAHEFETHNEVLFEEAPNKFRQVQPCPLARLKPNPRNARTHSKRQVGQIANSLLRFNVTSPIIVDEDGTIIAGHGRWLAAKQLGWTTFPVIVISNLSEAQKRALALADNKIASNAGWDSEILAKELGELAPLLSECNLDISITGFATAEIDALMVDNVDPEQDPADQLIQPEAVAVSHRGDIWKLGRHRLSCGDSGLKSDMDALMGSCRAAMIFADPPYNVRVSSIQGRGTIKHREFVSASGEMSPEQFTAYLKKFMRLAALFSHDGSIHFVCMDWRHLHEIMTAGGDVYSELKNLVVWTKSNAGQGSFYRSQHELIFVFKNGEAPHQNNIELGRYGRSRSNVWAYAGINTFRKDRLAELTVHPTVKPIALVADAMRDCSRRGDVVLDPFAGSGTTILAAERVGRIGFGMEIDPLYVDVAIRRWQDLTKRDAVLEATGQTFEEIAASGTGARKRVRL
jgi:DNA modification methylase